MEQKYGHDKVCSIGTYTVLQIKSAFKDLCRGEGVDISLTNILSKIFSDAYEEGGALREDWPYVFKVACKDGLMKKFVDGNPGIIQDMELVLGQPKAASVHACATLILPENESIFTSVPIRQGEINGEKLLVSEWEGEYIEKVGYLKEDILGIAQLDKFRMIINLIEENYGERVDIYSIPLDEPEVYKMFETGLSGDVFHLGSRSLTKFGVEFQPHKIEDLIAMLAVYRPGPIESNAHNELVSLRHGEREPIFYPGTEDITKDTYSLIIYQEQIMQICQKIGGFSLIEADDIRKAMGKLNQKLLDSYKERWFNGALENGYSEQVVSELWDKMVAFGGYAFNKSHSAAYAITGYICQYLKWKYPLPYWITALEFASDNNVLRFLSEISKDQNIGVSPPDINKSDIKFKADFKTNKIIWSISKVKQCGPVAVQSIFEERNNNGQFFSLEEFLERVQKSKVNKSVVENLILSGAFDDLEGVKQPSERRILIEEYRKKMNIKPTKDKDWFTNNSCESYFYEDWFWSLLQKQISGLAFFDYYSLVQNKTNWNLRKYTEISEINSLSNADQKRKRIVTGGFIQEIEERESKRGSWMKVLVEQNYEFVWLYLWSELYDKFADSIRGNEGNILIFNGRVVFDDFKKENIVQAEEDFQIEILSKT